jgi:hypothetical protein
MNQIMTGEEKSQLSIELTSVLNKNGMENHSNTPDWVLGDYLVNCLETFFRATRDRDNFYGGRQSINESEKGKRW